MLQGSEFIFCSNYLLQWGVENVVLFKDIRFTNILHVSMVDTAVLTMSLTGAGRKVMIHSRISIGPCSLDVRNSWFSVQEQIDVEYIT